MDDRELAGRLERLQDGIDACFKEIMFLSANLVKDEDDEVKENHTLESENSIEGEDGDGVISPSSVNSVLVTPSKKKHKIRVKEAGES